MYDLYCPAHLKVSLIHEAVLQHHLRIYNAEDVVYAEVNLNIVFLVCYIQHIEALAMELFAEVSLRAELFFKKIYYS